MTAVAKGEVAFSNVVEHEVYAGQSTGKYSLVITMEEQEAQKLADLGVRIKDYDGKSQRKFASKFHVPVIDNDGVPMGGEIPRGSKVNILYQLGDEHPQYGTGVYLQKVRVTEEATGGEAGPDPEDF